MTPEKREQARRDFIAEAITVLNRSLDYQETLASLAWIAVPRIADLCTVNIIEDGALRRLAVAHADPAKLAIATELAHRFPADPDASSGIQHILRTGEPELYPRLTPERVAASAKDASHAALLAELGLRSYIGVPIRRGDVTIGVITLIMAESGRHYDEHDLATAAALADRAAVAIENAQLFRELERAHAFTAAERDRLGQLVGAAPMAIAVLRGPHLVFEVVNEHFERTFGGRKLRGLPQAALDPTGAHSTSIRQVLATGVGTHERERAVTFDWDGTGTATTRYFNLSMAPLRDATGEFDGVVTFSLDVTEQVLGRRHLEEAHTAAELANRAKDEFLAMLGHELRNPLAPILTALELMALRDPTTFVRERTVIERQVRHVVRLVDDLLDVSRITRGDVTLHCEPLELAEVVSKGIELASPLLEARGHDLQTDVPRGLRLDGDPVRLAQVISNLLSNAARYTPPGGSIVVTSRQDGATLVLSVRDTGVGMDSALRERVFDAFFQGRQALDRAHGGLGLGLAIVRSLVVAHGGTVEALSEGVGRGSELVVRLPARAADAELPPPTSALPPRPAPRRAEKVLIVDDNVDAAGLIADALARRGFPTLQAYDAPSALLLAEKDPPDVALLDIGLPVMDGYELGRRLRELPGLAGLRLVAITGYGQASDLEQSRAAGFAAHLVKPISIATVVATLDRLTRPPTVISVV